MAVLQGMVTDGEAIHHPGITMVPGMAMHHAGIPIQVTSIIPYFPAVIYPLISEAIPITITAVYFTVITMVFMNPYMPRLAFM